MQYVSVEYIRYLEFTFLLIFLTNAKFCISNTILSTCSVHSYCMWLVMHKKYAGIIHLKYTLHRANHSDVQDKLLAVIKQWQRSDSSASWEQLAAALDRVQKYGKATAFRFRQAVGLLSGIVLYICGLLFYVLWLWPPLNTKLVTIPTHVWMCHMVAKSHVSRIIPLQNNHIR